MIYILIVLWWPANNMSGKAATTQEFNTKQACEAAKAEVLQMGGGLVRAVCVPKGQA